MMQEDFYWVGFSTFSGVGPVKFNKLLELFGSAKDAWLAEETALLTVLGKALTPKFLAFRKTFSVEGFAKKLADKNISYLLSKDTNYPQLLQKIPNPPFVLYSKGDAGLVSETNKTIAVVGTRKVTQYGEEVTKLLTKALVEQKFVIISGLALGVDALAHQSAIAGNGKTIAVLGCGVDCCSPSINQPIYDKIVGNFGAVVSESAFGQAGSKGMFPSRNRIIAGLSLGVLVTEGAEDSGSLITAQRALEIPRPVFAVPGQITATLSRGPLSLIQKGAKVVQTVDDILQTLHVQKNQNLQKLQQKKVRSEIPEEQLIITLLENEPLHFDEIVRIMGKSSGLVGGIISMMEMKEMIKNSGGKFYIKE